MFITEVRLENIKSYAAQRRIELRTGVNALIGHNGAGKSTVVEAIGAALFGQVPYKQDDFIRRGSKSGRVTVSIESDLDERDYQVVRQFGRGATWYVYDEEVGLKLAEGHEAVTGWIREHLQLDEDVDLKEYWENVGPPQGTLTAPFLGTASERNAKFLPLLRVEGFQRAYQDLLPAKQYIERQRVDLEGLMAGLRARLERRERVQADRDTALRLALDADRQLTLLQAEMVESGERRQAFDQAERALAEQQNRFRLQQQRVDSAEQMQTLAERQVARARQAEVERTELADEYRRYQELGEGLKLLEQRREQRDRLLEGRNTRERERDLARAELAQAEARLQEAERAFQDLRQLAQRLPDRAERGPAANSAEVEDRFRRALGEAKAQLDQAMLASETLQHARDTVRSDQHRQHQIQTQLEALKLQIADCETERPLAEQLEERMADAEHAKQAHADARAALDLTSSASAELGGGLCPILRETCQNVASKSGGDLAAYFTQQLEAGQQAVASAQQLLERSTHKLEAARRAAESIARLPDLRARLESLAQQEQDLAARLTAARREIAERSLAQEQLQQAQQRYEELSAFTREVNRLGVVAERRRASAAEVESQRAAVLQAEQWLAEAEAILAPFAALDDELHATRDEMDRAQEAYERYLALENEASSLPEREQARERAVVELTAERERLAAAASALDCCRAEYDPDGHQRARDHEAQLQRRVADCQAELRLARRQAAEALEELEALEQVDQELARRKREHQELGEAVLLAEHLRQSLRQAGPQIIRALLAHVSEIASRAFADIMGDNSLELEWGKDFEILVRQSGQERVFRQLSGGEQMAAALAVRMALQQLLGRTGLLILDEPTANMDEARRAHLAQQIEALKGYKQVILVSHSDEFDSMFGHIVHLSRSNGESEVGSELERGSVAEVG
jgi:exonuclease SbcC